MARSTRLRTRIVLAVAAGAVLVAVGATLVLINTIGLRNSAAQTARGDAYLVSIIDLERLVVNAETGLRGYVITGRSLFLAPTRSAADSFPQTVADLRAAAGAAGGSAAEARSLEQAAEQYMTVYVPHTLALAERDRRQAQSLAVTLQGKQLVDRIRARTAALEHAVSAREQARQVSARSSADQATTEAIVVLVLLTLLTLLLGGVLGRLVIARDRARAESEATTETLQASLLPPALPRVPGCEVAARFDPAGAGELVGGDFYDVFRVGHDQWAAIVGDVCGKGAQAAALTGMARWTLRSLASEAVGPADALTFLNRAMRRLSLNGRFITVSYVLVAVADEEVHLEVACGGHPPPILVPAHRDPSPVPAAGPLLGIWDDVRFNTRAVTLGPGDAIVLYTDGVTDTGPGRYRNPTEAFRGAGAGRDADQLAATLQAFSRAERSPQRDDVAILALRFCGRSRGSGA